MEELIDKLRLFADDDVRGSIRDLNHHAMIHPQFIEERDLLTWAQLMDDAASALAESTQARERLEQENARLRAQSNANAVAAVCACEHYRAEVARLREAILLALGEVG